MSSRLESAIFYVIPPERTDAALSRSEWWDVPGLRALGSGRVSEFARLPVLGRGQSGLELCFVSAACVVPLQLWTKSVHAKNDIGPTTAQNTIQKTTVLSSSDYPIISSLNLLVFYT